MLDFLGNLKRTHYCGALRAKDAGKDAVVLGWVAKRRDLGNLLFLDVRDRTGIVQVVFNKETQPEAHAKAEHVRSEYVVAVEGKVIARQKSNPDLATGEIEIIANTLHILNNAKTPPFPIEDEINAAEETRLRYRYLDLRRPRQHANLALRHKILLEIRKTMDEMGFLEVETPMLTRSTPEGARDYLVPSRVHHGQFYALPQSPQIFKQILMISGLDRYFQIVKCFRDEDLRADRQPEFTQLDVEMSFPRQEDIFHVIEQVMVRACAVAGVKAAAPFPHMLYKDAVRKYGSDKPDLRFGMELHEVTDAFPQEAKEKLLIEGNVFAFAAPGAATYSRKQLDELTEKAKSSGAKGAYFVKLTAEGTTSTVEKLIGRKRSEAGQVLRSKNRRPDRSRFRQDANQRHRSRGPGRRPTPPPVSRSPGRCRQIAMEIPVANGLPPFRMEPLRQNLGQCPTPVHRHSRRRPGKTRNRPVGSPLQRL